MTNFYPGIGSTGPYGGPPLLYAPVSLPQMGMGGTMPQSMPQQMPMLPQQSLGMGPQTPGGVSGGLPGPGMGGGGGTPPPGGPTAPNPFHLGSQPRFNQWAKDYKDTHQLTPQELQNLYREAYRRSQVGLAGSAGAGPSTAPAPGAPPPPAGHQQSPVVNPFAKIDRPMR